MNIECFILLELLLLLMMRRRSPSRNLHQTDRTACHLQSWLQSHTQLLLINIISFNREDVSAATFNKHCLGRNCSFAQGERGEHFWVNVFGKQVLGINE